MCDFIAEQGAAKESEIPQLFNSMLNGREVFAYCQYTTGIVSKEYDDAIEMILLIFWRCGCLIRQARYARCVRALASRLYGGQ